MFFGKPVIVTGYSGNIDFTSEANACIVDFRLIPVGDSVFRTKIADAGQNFIRSHHSFARLAERYRRRFDQIKQFK